MRMMVLGAVLGFSLMTAAPAQAEPKPWIWGWWPGHWQNLDFIPHLENGTHPHNIQWDKVVWKSGDWIAQRESELELIHGFYTADILRDQYVEDDVPVLAVGPGFYMLGGHDKRRVTETIDDAYGVTTSRVYGMYRLVDERTDRPIGAYTKYGLQIQ